MEGDARGTLSKSLFNDLSDLAYGVEGGSGVIITYDDPCSASIVTKYYGMQLQLLHFPCVVFGNEPCVKLAEL